MTMTKEELIEGWEYVLEHSQSLSSEMRELIQTTINVLQGKPDPDRQKAIDTWAHMLMHDKPSSNMTRRIDASLYHMYRSS